MKNKYEILRERRRDCADIPTDAEGNLILNKPNRVSGKKWRQEHTSGVFYKKDENHNNSRSHGTYIQYAANPIPPEKQDDIRKADADEKAE
jgi:hypothetical protein